jgi:hypothetical protein
MRENGSVFQRSDYLNKWTRLMFRDEFIEFRCCHIYKTYTYLHTPWNRVLREKLTGFYPVKKFPTYYGNRWLFAAFTRTRHQSLSCTRSIHYMLLHLTSRRSFLILSSHLRLGLTSGLFASGFPTNNLVHLFSHSYVLHAPLYLVILDLITQIIFGEEYRYLQDIYCHRFA